MSDTSLRGGADVMTPARLRIWVDEQLEISKTRREIVDDLMAMGVDRDTASGMVNDSIDDQWHADGGGGPALGRVGPKHMIIGALLVAGGIAATWASVYAAMNFGVSVSYLFYGAIIAGAMEFVYGLIRFLDG